MVKLHKKKEKKAKGKIFCAYINSHVAPISNKCLLRRRRVAPNPTEYLSSFLSKKKKTKNKNSHPKENRRNLIELNISPSDLSIFPSFTSYVSVSNHFYISCRLNVPISGSNVPSRIEEVCLIRWHWKAGASGRFEAIIPATFKYCEWFFKNQKHLQNAKYMS